MTMMNLITLLSLIVTFLVCQVASHRFVSEHQIGGTCQRAGQPLGGLPQPRQYLLGILTPPLADVQWRSAEKRKQRGR